MDGMKAPPLVFDRGFWRGVLNLIVLECRPGPRAYSVQIRCEIYCAYEEMIYSIADHGKDRGYNGNVYIKEAKESAVIESLGNMHPRMRGLRQFVFVGGDHCYETVGFTKPVIQAFASQDDAYGWAPGRDT
jgi:hypothetical protein